MISAIGSGASFLSSLFGTNSSSGTSGSSSTANLSQTEEQLFASIDGDGNGSISQSEFTNFLNKTASAAGDSSAPSTATSNALFAQLSGGSGSIGLAQFESNAGDLVSQLQSEIAAGSAGSGNSTSSLLSQLTQGAQSLVAGSAASITQAGSTNSSSNTGNTNSSSGGHHHHHDGGNSLISQFLQQYQASGATASLPTSTLSASA